MLLINNHKLRNGLQVLDNDSVFFMNGDWRVVPHLQL